MKQAPIDDDAIDHLRIRRHQLCTSWTDVVKLSSPGDNYCLVLPFPETFENAFESMYTREFYANHASGGRLQLWLNDSTGEATVPEEAQQWIDTVGKYVAIQDYLAISFALDFTHIAGNPAEAKSSVGKLRREAKPYSEAATKTHHKAAKMLASRCVDFLEEMSCYSGADCVVAVPPSDPEKAYSLPKLLAAEIAEEMGIDDLSESIVTTQKRESIKQSLLAEKLKSLRGTIAIDPDVFKGRTVLLIDDLYQSGTTMNYCAQLVLEVGAEIVLGLACEKTCRNDDNQAGG